MIIENDDEKGRLEVQLSELEKALKVIRIETDQIAFQNEKLRLSKDERTASDLNLRVFVERKQNDEAREQLKEVEDRR
jgi:hypothetical protein